MPNKVNLDALMLREDFEVADTPVQYPAVQTLQIRDLETGSLFYQLLRKPDFQRETSDWTDEKIFEFVQSFLNGDLIPGIILWNSGSHIFVIDGAHRLSALVAWVQDDYGDGPVSRAFYEQRIPPEQLKAAEATRALIAKNIGDYSAHKYVIAHPSNADPALLARATRLATLAIQVQWVPGNAEKAEDSFFKINQQAVAIDPTELRLLKARKMPNALSARAIIHSGAGHKYWSKFAEDKRKQIQDIAKEIHNLLFTPILKTPIKTLDLPIAGHGYSAQTLQLVFELINLANDIRIDSSKKGDKKLSEDNKGEETIFFLKNTRKIVYRMTGDHAPSLGLHPAIYFYGANGRYQPTAFLAVAGLIKDFERLNYYAIFTKHRSHFEQFLLGHKEFANQVATVRGSGTKGMKTLQAIYQAILDGMEQEKTDKDIEATLLQDERFPFLKLDESKNINYRRDFDSATKSTAFLRDAIRSALTCKICNGFIHSNSISIDHKERKEDGGLGTLDNAQLTHPYCNTTYKN